MTQRLLATGEATILLIATAAVIAALSARAAAPARERSAPVTALVRADRGLPTGPLTAARPPILIRIRHLEPAAAVERARADTKSVRLSVPGAPP